MPQIAESLCTLVMKRKPSLKIELPEKFLRTCVVGSVEVLDVLMGFPPESGV